MKLKAVFFLFFMAGVCLSPSKAVYALEDFKFKDADMQIVLQAISQKAIIDVDDQGNVTRRANIIVSPEVRGLVTVNLIQVNWLAALEGILTAYGYGYEWVKDDLILVTTLEDLAERRSKAVTAAQQEPLETRIYSLKYLDAKDVMNVIAAQLSPRGKVSVLSVEPPVGWKAKTSVISGAEKFAAAERASGAKPRSSKLVITETKSKIQNVIGAIEAIDVMPKQVLIKARIMEVNRDTLKDIGFDWATGSDGFTSGNYDMLNISGNNKRTMGGNALSTVTSSIFNPKAVGITGTYPYSAGLEFVYRKLTGAQFETVLHALEENVNTNILSSPHILTLDGQEAYIMIGDYTPILKSDAVASQTSTEKSFTMDYYQPLGISLNVVPHINDEQFVHMLIYPSITSSFENVTTPDGIDYPIIKSRETQTQVIMRDGETIVIGGLLKDVKSESVIKTPILGDLPFLGLFFQKKTWDTEKVDLLIFITAHIVDPSEALPQTFTDINPVVSKFGDQDKSIVPFDAPY